MAETRRNAADGDLDRLRQLQRERQIRLQHFAEALDAPVVDQVFDASAFAIGAVAVVAEDGGDPGTARENARELLEKHPELAGYVGTEPYHLTALAAAATDAKRNGYVGLVGMGWPENLGEPLEKGFINGVVFPNPQALASVLIPMIRAAASGDGSYAWPESGKVAMPLATRFVPKPYGVTEMIHGLPGNWNIKSPEGKPEPSPGKFD